MTSTLHDVLDPKTYALSQDQFDDLCVICDKLLLMAQLAGTPPATDEDSAMLLIRRVLLGQLFGEMSFQLRDVLQAVCRSKTGVDVSSKH
ncbi:hypothetical protein DWU98_20480 [Dyella monticola]|uniref:Uncharacterized protein n=1 Tax=Dyella monticola TaxID=1927958 RepID=A0A370WRV4_9GAMM|nr:hypothetical protein [Dyella monticola]RDS78899.1 hypothetical protein DWU98_20480 [Dyella monticola]